MLAEGVEVGRGTGGRGDEEGVLADAGDGDEVAAVLYLGVDDVVVVVGLEADLDTGLTLGVVLGAVGGVFGASGLAGFTGTLTTALIWLGMRRLQGACACAAAGTRVASAAKKRVGRIVMGSGTLDATGALPRNCFNLLILLL